MSSTTVMEAVTHLAGQREANLQSKLRSVIRGEAVHPEDLLDAARTAGWSVEKLQQIVEAGSAAFEAQMAVTAYNGPAKHEESLKERDQAWADLEAAKQAASEAAQRRAAASQRYEAAVKAPNSIRQRQKELSEAPWQILRDRGVTNAIDWRSILND